jgi:enamine deaminase RidA (YjgF/YER057c/UK114 family)
MAIKFHNPTTVALAGKYSLGAEVPPGARVLYVAGQVGLDSKGKLQPTFEKQAVQAWKNIGQVLKAAGMGYRDIVKITSFITDGRYLLANRAAREQFIKSEPYPASTLLVVAGLADPAMLVEIEVVAAKA